MKKTLRISLALLLTVLLVPFTSCKKDDPEPDVIASFTFKIDDNDFKKVEFTNESQNFSALSWDFGDGTALSTETNPVHTYAAVGEYTVKLTATSQKGTTTDVYTKKVTIADPNEMLTRLVGESSKTWKLLRDVSGGVYPLEVGPWAHNEIWWAMGRNNDELANRPCMLNDEFTFTRDGKLIIDRKGDYWAEGGIYVPANICASTSDPMVGAAGEDLSAWKGGTFAFELDGANNKITAKGKGAFIGFEKLGNGKEVSNGASATNPIVLPESITYSVISLYDGTTDTLIVQGQYKWDDSDGGYWRFVLVHYDNPADEPPIPGNQPAANFTYVLDGRTATFTNTSNFATSYLWDFGDGSTSTETNPTHTFASDGNFTVSLTATNELGTNVKTVDIMVSTVELTNEILQGAPWRIRVAPNSIYVGPGMGDPSWWQTPVGFLDGSAAGTPDDWSCMVDDEFTFHADGKFTYDTKGSTRNDGYFGGTNGCITDEEIAASGNGAYFGSALGDDAHTYTFTPASGGNRAIIELTNSATRAAFIGFMKGYYGGENANGANPPNGGNPTNRYEVMGYSNNGTVETLIVSVDISGDHSGGASWTMVMVR